MNVGHRTMKIGIAAVAICMLAACSAGGASHGVPATPVTAPTTGALAPMTTSRFTITVPSATATATSSRAPRFVSPNTQSAIITLTSVNGTPFTGSATNPASIATNLTPSNPACSMSSGMLTCTASAPAVAGSDAYTVVTYDAMQSTATPIGHVLSQATLTIPVTAGQANPVTTPLVLTGVVNSIVVTPANASDPHILGTQATGYSIVGNQPYTFNITGKDASGATIVGSAAQGAPAFTCTSATPSAVAVTTANATVCTVQVKSASVSPATQALVPVALTVTPSQGSAATVNVTTVQELWVTNGGNTANNGSVTAYYSIPGANQSTQIPTDTIPGLTQPNALAVDGNGNLWVATFSASAVSSITAYVPGTSTPFNTISGASSGLNRPFGLAFDAGGHLWVASVSGNGSGGAGGGAITVYNVGPTPPTIFANDTITGGGLSSPVGLAFQSVSGSLWVANEGVGNGDITVSTPGTNAANSSITAGISVPFDLAFEASSGNLWVVNIEGGSGLGSVTEYAPGSNTVIATITTGLDEPEGLAFDASGNLWVANVTSGTVTEYAAASKALIATIPTTANLNNPGGLAFTP